MRQHPVFSADIIRTAVRRRARRGRAPPPRALRRQRVPGRPGRRRHPADRPRHVRGRLLRRHVVPAPVQGGAHLRRSASTSCERCRGTQFDPDMVDAFLRCSRTSRTRRRRPTRSPREAAAPHRPGDKHAVLREPRRRGAAPSTREIAQMLREVRDANPPTRFLTHPRAIDSELRDRRRPGGE